MIVFLESKNRHRPSVRKSKKQLHEIKKFNAAIAKMDKKQLDDLTADHCPLLQGLYETCGGGFVDDHSLLTRENESSEFVESSIDFVLEKVLEAVDLKDAIESIVVILII